MWAQALVMAGVGGEGKAGSAASTRAALDHSGDAGCGGP